MIDRKNYNIDAIESRVKKILSGKLPYPMALIGGYGWKLIYATEKTALNMIERLSKRNIHCEISFKEKGYVEVDILEVKKYILSRYEKNK